MQTAITISDTTPISFSALSITTAHFHCTCRDVQSAMQYCTLTMLGIPVLPLPAPAILPLTDTGLLYYNVRTNTNNVPSP
jgi:hypothetical protein